MAKRYKIKRISAKGQNAQIKEDCQEHAAWYVIVGRILWLLAMPLWICFCLSPFLFITVSLWDKLLGWNIIEYLVAHPLFLLAAAICMYLLFLIWFLVKLVDLASKKIDGGE